MFLPRFPLKDAIIHQTRVLSVVVPGSVHQVSQDLTFLVLLVRACWVTSSDTLIVSGSSMIQFWPGHLNTNVRHSPLSPPKPQSYIFLLTQ